MKYIRKFVKLVKSMAFYMLTWIYSLRYPMQENKVCFLSDVRDVMGGNLKSVYDYLEDKDYERVVLFKGDRRIRRTKEQRKQLLYELTTSKYILLDDFSSAIAQMRVRKGQEVVQLWHGPGAFKKFGWSRFDTGEKKKYFFHNLSKKYMPLGHKNYTKAIVSGSGITWCFAEAFAMKESQVKATGFPRMDVLQDKEYVKNKQKEFYSKYPELQEKKILLFAPTYRGEKASEAYYDFSKLNLEQLYEDLHEEYVFIIKWHPSLYNNIAMGIIEGPDFSKHKEFFLDFSEYRDINDLLLVCDCLITDYSSVIFDYVLLDKPIVYFTYDLSEYTEYGGRGLYFDFNEYVYGLVACTQDELMQAVRSDNLMPEKRKIFYDKFMGECDGHSTEKTCKWIFGE